MRAIYRGGVRGLRVAFASVIAVGWLTVTVLMLVAGNLMSVDEEWDGWGDILLNPYLIVPYVVITAGVTAGVWALCRRPT